MEEEPVLLGEYIFMGMGKCGGETVCMSVAYKIEYCIKKAKAFEELSKGVAEFTHINKVKVGELVALQKFNTKGE